MRKARLLAKNHKTPITRKSKTEAVWQRRSMLKLGVTCKFMKRYGKCFMAWNGVPSVMLGRRNFFCLLLFQVFSACTQFRQFVISKIGDVYSTIFGLPFTASQYCFGKVFPVWSFPAFYFMHANGDGNQSSFGRFRYYYVNYRTFPRR